MQRNRCLHLADRPGAHCRARLSASRPCPVAKGPLLCPWLALPTDPSPYPIAPAVRRKRPRPPRPAAQAADGYAIERSPSPEGGAKRQRMAGGQRADMEYDDYDTGNRRVSGSCALCYVVYGTRIKHCFLLSSCDPLCGAECGRKWLFLASLLIIRNNKMMPLAATRRVPAPHPQNRDRRRPKREAFDDDEYTPSHRPKNEPSRPGVYANNRPNKASGSRRDRDTRTGRQEQPRQVRPARRLLPIAATPAACFAHRRRLRFARLYTFPRVVSIG